MTEPAGSTRILGISAFYHDAAAAILVDGKVVAAQEERFTRKKHDPRFPVNAIEYCLSEANIELILLDRVTDLLAAEKVVGWMNGRMEFGPAPWARARLSEIRVALQCRRR